MTAALAIAVAVCLVPRVDADGIEIPVTAVHRIGSARMLHGFQAYAIAESPDGSTVAACGLGGWATAFETATGKPRWALRIGTGLLTNLSFSPDGKHVYFAEPLSRAKAGPPSLTIHRRDAATGAAVDLQTPRGQSVGVFTAFDTAGTVVVTTYGGMPLVVHDLTLNKTIKTYDTPKGSEVNVSVSDGGKTVAATFGQKLYIYDVAGGGRHILVSDAGDHAATAAVSPDGTVVAAIVMVPQPPPQNSTSELRLYDRAGKRLAEQPAAGDELIAFRMALAFNPDGKRVAFGGHARGVKVFDAATAKLLLDIPAPIGSPLAFSRDGKTVYTGTRGIQAWDAATGTRRPESCDMPAAGYGGRIEFLPEAGRVAVSTSAGDDRVTWDWRTGRETTRVSGPEAAALGYGRSVIHLNRTERIGTRTADGKRFARRGPGNNAGTVEIFDSATGKVTTKIDVTMARELKFTADAKHLIVGVGDSEVDGAAVCDAETGDVRRTLKSDVRIPNNMYLSHPSIHPAPVGQSVVLSESHAFNRRMLAEGSPDMQFTAGVYDAATGRRVAGIRGDGMLDTVVWNGDATRAVLAGTMTVASTEPDGFFGVVNAATGKWVFPQRRMKTGAGRPALSPDGKLVAVGTDAGIELWETASARLRASIPGPRQRDSSLAFAPDGRHLLSFGSGQAGLLDDTAALRPAGPTADPAADWAALIDPDAATAYTAMCRLAAGGDAAVAAIRKNLPPAAPLDPVVLKRMLGQLDSPKFADREAAVKELWAMGEAAIPAIRKTLDETTSAEVRKRAEKLLEAIVKPAPEALRAGRAVEVLTWTDSPKARGVLTELATGADGAPLTRDARRALR